ncbi:MAG: alpha/beta hydrolase-fold protein [Bacteroidota bacterium]|nr:alpha/beta hydrolase-fold protein [Bacteroidota bacterium]
MERILDSWESPNLGKEMPIVSYGFEGPAFLMFPSAAADFLEYERFYLIDSIKHHLDSGRIRCYSINSINSESWLNDTIDPKQKAIRHMQYNKYIVNEVYPYIKEKTGGESSQIYTMGVSFGALHAMNTLLRRPDLFDGVIGMSGVYDLKEYAKGYFDENVYFNSPMDYLPNLTDEKVLHQLRTNKKIYMYTGSGEYEDPSGSWKMADALGKKNIPNWVECWDKTWRHDWPTWRAMLPQAIEKYF